MYVLKVDMKFCEACETLTDFIVYYVILCLKSQASNDKREKNKFCMKMFKKA